MLTIANDQTVVMNLQNIANSSLDNVTTNQRQVLQGITDVAGAIKDVQASLKTPGGLNANNEQSSFAIGSDGKLHGIIDEQAVIGDKLPTGLSASTVPQNIRNYRLLASTTTCVQKFYDVIEFDGDKYAVMQDLSTFPTLAQAIESQARTNKYSLVGTELSRRMKSAPLWQYSTAMKFSSKSSPIKR